MRRFRMLLTACSCAWLVCAPGLKAAETSAEASSPETNVAPTAKDQEKAHPSTTAVKKDLTTVIDSQLAAFRAEDYGKAFTFAAMEIRQSLGVQAFEQMVKKGYPVIAHSNAAEYGLAFDTGEDAVVNVRVANADGQVVHYQYLLKMQDGRWRISGVVEIKPESITV